MPEPSQSQKSYFLVRTAAAVREAITVRERELEKPMAEYDAAVASGNQKEIESTGIILLLASSPIMDPVASAVKDYVRAAELLKGADGV